MSATRYKARPQRAPLNPQQIINRINIAIIIAILLFVAFILPWLGGH